MELKLFTLSFLVLLIILQKEASGKIKLAPNSLPLNIIEYDDLANAKDPFAAIRKCKVDDDTCNISPYHKIYAVISFDSPNDAEIDPFVYLAELKFEGYEISLNTTVKRMAENGFQLIANGINSRGSRLFITSLKDLDVPKRKNGTLTFSVQEVDEKGKVVSLWGITADVEVDKEEDEDENQYEEE